MNRLVFALILILVCSLRADAWIHGANLVPGRAQQNLGSDDLAPAFLINQFQALSVGTPPSSTAADAGIFDNQGYPISAPTSRITMTGPQGMWDAQTWKFNVTGTRIITVGFLNNIANCSATNITVTGGCAGGVTYFTSLGSPGSVTFTTSGGPTSSWSIVLDPAKSYGSGTGQVALYRLSDDAAFLAGKFWTPEFEGVLRAMRPRVLRTMGMVFQGIYTNQANWNYVPTGSDFTWGAKYPAGTWAGLIAVSNNQYTASLATDTPLTGWIDGEVLIGYTTTGSTAITISNIVNNGSGACRATVSSTSMISNGQAIWPASYNPINLCGGTDSRVNNQWTATVIDMTTVDFNGSTFSGGTYSSGGYVGIAKISVTGKSGGSKFIADGLGISVMSDGNTFPAGVITCTYKLPIDAVVCDPGQGISPLVPYSAMVQLANDVGSGLWVVTPQMATDNYLTSMASALLSLNPANSAYFEGPNENWNPAFRQFGWSQSMGEYLGLAGGGKSWYGLRTGGQFFGSIIPSVWTGRMSQVRRVLAYQAAGDTSFLTFEMQGSGLNQTTANQFYCTFTGGTWSGSCSGGKNYDTFPNRPADFAETFAIAPYATGANLCTSAPDFGCPTSGVSATWLQSLINTWQAGNTAAAIAMIDNDLQTNNVGSQTVTASGTTFTTSSPHGFTANQTDVWFTVTGGTTYSGLTAQNLYHVDTTPTNSTFTIKAYSGGFVTGSDVNAGTAGSGTTTVNTASTGGFNMIKLASTWVAFGEYMATQFDASRPGGANPIRLEWYEGALEPVGPSDAQCTTLGLTSTGDCSTTIFNAIQAWRSHPTSSATIQEYYNSLLGLDPNFAPTYNLLTHSKTPANLVLPGPITNPGGAYSLLTNQLPNSEPYFLYNGIATFSNTLPATP